MPDIRAWTLGLGLAACSAEPTEIPGPSYSVFRDRIHPLLLRDCGFVQCHGDTNRFFVLYGPGRTRLDEAMEFSDPPTEDELWLSYQSSRGMLTHDHNLLDSPLLTKPLEGRGHAGLDDFGRNVWQVGDPSWQAVEQWARGVP